MRASTTCCRLKDFLENILSNTQDKKVHREGEREGGTEREVGGERERDRQTDRQRQRQTERERDVNKQK